MIVKHQTNNYRAEIDHVGKNEWSDLLQLFNDASIYQTWSYGSIRWGENKLGHVVLKKDGEIVALAQSRIVKLPGIDSGMVYIFRGPIWRLRGKENDIETK